MIKNNSLKLLVLCPHFEPDTAPTGAVMTRIVHELVELGHEVHVVTALPWYRQHRVEPEWREVTWRTRQATTPWGSITRLDPFAGDDKKNLFRRALGFLGFSALSIVAGMRAGRGTRVDAVLAMSPPLTLGLSGWLIASFRRAPLVFNIQDVFPDAAIETRAITNPLIIKVARLLEKLSYRLSKKVTVLSDDLRDNVAAKLPVALADKVVVIPNFVDTASIRPMNRLTAYRDELGIDDRLVVMYAGNVGFSQSLPLMLAAARAIPEVAFVINGSGSARESLEHDAQGIDNIYFGDFQPAARLSEVLATGDIQVVLLRRGLGRVSVPSKSYSIMAAGRAMVAAIDAGTQVPRLIAGARCGRSVEPDDELAFIAALRELISVPSDLVMMGEQARNFVMQVASPSAVAQQYVDLFMNLRSGHHL